MTENLLDVNPDQNIDDPTKDYLSELVGDGKKFKTAQDLARGKLEADRHINNLVREQSELRNDYLALREQHMAGATMQELIDRVSKLQPVTNSNTPPANELIQPNIDAKQIESLIDTRMEAREQTRKADANFNSVKAKLQERHGANYANVLNEQANKLGLTAEYVNNIARTSPEAFSRMFGLDTQNTNNNFQTPPSTSRRADSFSPQSTTKRTEVFYEKLRKTDPKSYWDPKTQIQMDKDSQSLGKDFFDADI